MEESHNRAGILMMIGAMFVFTLSDTIGKWLVKDYSVWQVVGVRSVAALILLGAILYRQRGNVKISIKNRPGIQMLRLGFVLIEVWASLWAFRYLPLADVFMFYAASPLFMTAFSALLLKEPVGIQRWSAVVAGLIGVIFVFPPTEAAVSLPALVALAGSMSLALMLVLTRMLRNSDGLDLLVLQTLAVGIVGIASFGVTFSMPSAFDFGLMAAMGIMATGGHFLMNKSVSVAPSAVVAPFQYTSIVWAIIMGYLIWADIPTAQALFGVAIIVTAGLFVLYREWRLGKKRKSLAQPPQ